MPSVRLLSGTTVADPVGFDTTLAGNLVGVQACLGIQLPVPVLHHWVLAVCHNRLALVRLLAVLCSTYRAAAFVARAVVNGCLPFTPVLTLPNHNLPAAGHVVVCSAWVLVTELSNNIRVFGGKEL